MKGRLFLMQVWPVAFLHLCELSLSHTSTFPFQPMWQGHCPSHVNVHYLGNSGYLQRQHKRERVFACVCMRAWEFRALRLASWTHRCSQNHSGVKGILQQPSTTRNVDVIFSVLWNILISCRLQGGIQIAPGSNWHTLYLLLVIFLLIFFSFHQFLIDFWYGKPCVCSCEFKGAEIQMLLIDGHDHRKIIYAELVWLFSNNFLLH